MDWLARKNRAFSIKFKMRWPRSCSAPWMPCTSPASNVIGGEFEDRDKRVIRFGVVVHQQLPRINLAAMNQVVFRLIDLAAPFDGAYDGWGTMQVRVAS